MIELFPGANWITLTTRLFDLGDLPKRGLRSVYEKLLKANATVVEVNFGIDKRNCLMIRNAVPVTGVSYDIFNSAYEAHLAGIRFFHEKMKTHLTGA
ncbi:hypothetical protein EU546_05015 [Candidatus Thorarchaeota archaeon]|nr:MAG: hypothetical protein EU546_05015 [Candidatus Thorarchaeota archaeon]